MKLSVIAHGKIHSTFNFQFMKRLFLIFLAAATSLVANSQESGWINLFNGKNLDGWKQLNGKARFEVVDGEIVGTSVYGTPNSFLATEADYGDFVLELDLRLDSEMNSGIQIRSQSLPEYNNGRVHGYQVEVDPSARAWSGGIYDEARRGWLYPLEINPSGQSAFRRNEWNHYKIECIGSSIRTWINGIPTAWIYDDMTPKGFFALQVHSVNNREQEGWQIRWKNIRIKTTNLQPAPFEDIYVVNLLKNQLTDAEKRQGFRLLYDGKTSSGWKKAVGAEFPAKGWEFRNGELVVLPSSVTGSERGGDIVTTEKFKAFELRFDFNMSEGANSGVKYFTGNNGPSIGCEYQILDDARHPDATQGAAGNRKLASLYDLIPAEAEARFINQPGQWNRGAIVVYPDNRVEHWLNGRKVVEYVRGNNIFRALVARSKFAVNEGFGMAEEAPILLQDHNDEVRYRNIKIRIIQ